MRWITAGLVAGLMAVPALAAADLCSATAKAAKRACRNKLQDDVWIAIGNCNNLSSAGARNECKAEAVQELPSGFGHCRDQFLARQGLCEASGGGPHDPIVVPEGFLDPIASSGSR